MLGKPESVRKNFLLGFTPSNTRLYGFFFSGGGRGERNEKNRIEQKIKEKVAMNSCQPFQNSFQLRPTSLFRDGTFHPSLSNLIFAPFFFSLQKKPQFLFSTIYLIHPFPPSPPFFWSPISFFLPFHFSGAGGEATRKGFRIPGVFRAGYHPFSLTKTEL